jgi:hypothetical protein
MSSIRVMSDPGDFRCLQVPGHEDLVLHRVEDLGLLGGEHAVPAHLGHHLQVALLEELQLLGEELVLQGLPRLAEPQLLADGHPLGRLGLGLGDGLGRRDVVA